MNDCLEVADFREMSDQIVSEFDRQVASISDGSCVEFHIQARDMETQLLTIYRMVVRLARKSEDLDQIARWWKSMGDMCDDSISRLDDLEKQHPGCGASWYRDRLTDLKNKCLRLQMMHC